LTPVIISICNFGHLVKNFLEISSYRSCTSVVGQGRLLFVLFRKPPPRSQIGRSSRRAKRKGGLGEGIFARLLTAPKARQEWESVSAIPASAGRQNRKIFVSLIEKNFGGAPLKNVKKIFLFCSPSGGRKRWVGFLPVRAEIVARTFFERNPD